MERLRSPHKINPTTGKRWLPFHFNIVRASKKARLHRLVRKGLTIPTDKASLRAAADQAIAEHPELLKRPR